MKHFLFSIVIISVFIFTSCVKDGIPKPDHPFVGKYDGIMTTTTWSLVSGSSSSSAQEYIDVIQDGDTVEVFGIRMHEDSLVDKKSYYNGSGSNFLSFEFRNDSLLMNSNYGGLGGGTNSNYAGGKIN